MIRTQGAPRWLVLLGFGLGLAWPLEAANDKNVKRPVDEIRQESKKLFGKLAVVPLSIRIDGPDLGKLQKSYTNVPVYVPAEIRQGGQVYPKVGVHLRGISTFQPVEEKPNFTLKFNQFVDGQKFHGLRKVRLSNALFDNTYLQEWLGRELFTAAGVAAPRVKFARVELNGRDLGLYVMVEGVTQDFLRLNWGTDAGSVYEGDETDIDGVMEQDYGKRNQHQTDLRPLVEALNEPDLSRRAQRLGQTIDLKVFASYVAVEAIMNLWDGYSMRINNYRVFCNHEDGRTYFIPHGIDRLFEDPGDSIMPKWKGRVTQVLLATPETRKLYLRRLSELSRQLMARDSLFKQLDEASEAILPTLKELNLDRHQSRALTVFKKRIERRIEVLEANLPSLVQESESRPGN